MYMYGQKWFFSGITPKVLTFQYYARNKTYPEVNVICVYQIWLKLIEKWPPQNPRWPPRNLDFLTFQHQTAVISRASSSLSCLFICLSVCLTDCDGSCPVHNVQPTALKFGMIFFQLHYIVCRRLCRISYKSITTKKIVWVLPKFGWMCVYIYQTRNHEGCVAAPLLDIIG